MRVYTMHHYYKNIVILYIIIREWAEALNYIYLDQGNDHVVSDL